MAERALSTGQGQGSATILQGRPQPIQTGYLAGALEEYQDRFDEQLAKKAIAQQKFDKRLDEALKNKKAFSNQTLKKKADARLDQTIEEIRSGKIPYDQVSNYIAEATSEYQNALGIDKMVAQQLTNNKDKRFFKKGEEKGNFVSYLDVFGDEFMGQSEEHEDLDIEEYGANLLKRLAGGMETGNVYADPQSTLNNVFGELVTKLGQEQTVAAGQVGDRELIQKTTTVPESQLFGSFAQEYAPIARANMAVEQNRNPITITDEEVMERIQDIYDQLDRPTKREQKDVATKSESDGVTSREVGEVTTERSPLKKDKIEYGESEISVVPIVNKTVTFPQGNVSIQGKVKSVFIDEDGTKMANVDYKDGDDMKTEQVEFDLIAGDVPANIARAAFDKLEKIPESERVKRLGFTEQEVEDIDIELQKLNEGLGSKTKEVQQFFDKYLPDWKDKYEIEDPSGLVGEGDKEDIEVIDKKTGESVLYVNTSNDKDRAKTITWLAKERKGTQQEVSTPAKTKTPIPTQKKPR